MCVEKGHRGGEEGEEEEEEGDMGWRDFTWKRGGVR